MEQFLSKISLETIKEFENQRKLKISNEKDQLISQIQERISAITMIKKRKMDNQTFCNAVQQLKNFLNSVKCIVQTYFRLIIDDQKLALFSQSQIQQMIGEIRFSLLRSVHNMNRILIKSTENQQVSIKKNQNQKKKKKRKGKNSKLDFKATGMMHQWILQNFTNPYPSNQDKEKIRKRAGISVSKVNYWFINVRQRTLKRIIASQASNKKICMLKTQEGSNQSEESIMAESS